MSKQRNSLLDELEPRTIARALRKQPGGHDDIFDVKHTWVSIKDTTLLVASIIAFLLCMQNRSPFALMAASIAVGIAGFACFRLFFSVTTREETVTRADLISLQNRSQSR